MSLFSRIYTRGWIVLPVCACGFLIWVNHGRMQRVEYVSGLAGGAVPAEARAAASATGYAREQRALIVPERTEESFHSRWVRYPGACSGLVGGTGLSVKCMGFD